MQEFLPIERGGLFLFCLLALFFGLFLRCVWLGWEVCYHLTTTLLMANLGCLYSKKPVSILSGKTNLATNIPAGALPTPMKAKQFNGLESQLSILTVLSPLKSKKHLCEKCFLALDNRLSTIVCIKL